MQVNELISKKCIPCEVGGDPFSEEKIKAYTPAVPTWEVVDNLRIKKEFRFENFRQAMDFVNKVSVIAESEGHHPDIYIFYNQVRLELFTHEVGGLSENDFILAAKVDNIKFS